MRGYGLTSLSDETQMTLFSEISQPRRVRIGQWTCTQVEPLQTNTTQNTYKLPTRKPQGICHFNKYIYI